MSYEPSVIHSGATTLIASPGAVFIIYTAPTAPGSTVPAEALLSANTTLLTTPRMANATRLRLRTCDTTSASDEA